MTETLLQSFLERHNHRLVIEQHGELIYFGVRDQLEEIPLISRNVKARADLYMPLSDMPRIITELNKLGITPAGTVDTQTHQPVIGANAIVALPKIITNQGKAGKQGCYSRTPDGDIHGFNGGYVYIDIQTPEAGQNGWRDQPVMEPFELHFGMDGTAIQQGGADMPDGFGFVIVFNQQQARILLQHLMNLTARIQYNPGTPGNQTTFDLYVDGKHYQAVKDFAPVQY